MILLDQNKNSERPLIKSLRSPAKTFHGCTQPEVSLCKCCLCGAGRPVQAPCLLEMLLIYFQMSSIIGPLKTKVCQTRLCFISTVFPFTRQFCPEEEPPNALLFQNGIRDSVTVVFPWYSDLVHLPGRLRSCSDCVQG